MRFTAQLLKQRGEAPERLYYLLSEFQERQVYYFVLIEPPKEKLFLAALASPVAAELNLDHYGQVLEKGYGEAPPEVKQAMERTYGIRFEE